MVGNGVPDTVGERRRIPYFRPERVSEEGFRIVLEASRRACLLYGPIAVGVHRSPRRKARRGVQRHRRGVENTDREFDPLHFRDGSAVADLNMPLAAHALGPASHWIGSPGSGPGTAASPAEKFLEISDTFKVVTIPFPRLPRLHLSAPEGALASRGEGPLRPLREVVGPIKAVKALKPTSLNPVNGGIE